MSCLLSALRFPSGHQAKNRFALAPLTNGQSAENGELGEDEVNWMAPRAQGGFGMLISCASHVQENGKAYSGQLGIWDDRHVSGLTRLAGVMKAGGGLALVQLHHGGMRALPEFFSGGLVCASDHPKSGARGLSTQEVYQLIDAFVSAAWRAQRAGFDGIELHAGHGYLLQEFLSSTINQRTDEFGGRLAGRSKIVFDVIDGIRRKCGANFMLGVRLSPERFGMTISETLETSQRLIDDGKIDFLDLSLWDCFKVSNQPGYETGSMISHFAKLNRGTIPLGVAGKIYTPEDAERALDGGADFVLLGRAAILNHDFPARYEDDPHFEAVQMPTTIAHLRKEGLSRHFIDRIKKTWPGFFTENEDVLLDF